MASQTKTTVCDTFKSNIIDLGTNLLAEFPDDLFALGLETLKQADSSVLLPACIPLCDTDKIAEGDHEAFYVLCAHETLACLNIKAKLEASKDPEAYWAQIKAIAKVANVYKLYDSLPAGLLNVVSETAMTLKDDIDSGRASLQTLNPMELGKHVMSKFDPEELKVMMKKLTENEGLMTGLMSQMTDMMASSGTAGPDIQGLMGKFMNP